MNIKKSPCYNCEFRTIGCHANCDKYNDWRSLMKEFSKNASKSRYFIDNRVNIKHHVKCGVYRTTKK